MPAGLGVLILLVLVALGGGVAMAAKKREPEKLPPAPQPPTPPPEQTTFTPIPSEPARLPPTPAGPTYYLPEKAPSTSAKEVGMRKLKAMVDKLGPEPSINDIMEAKILAGQLGATATDDTLTDRLKVAVARVQEQERLHTRP